MRRAACDARRRRRRSGRRATPSRRGRARRRPATCRCRSRPPRVGCPPHCAGRRHRRPSMRATSAGSSAAWSRVANATTAGGVRASPRPRPRPPPPLAPGEAARRRFGSEDGPAVATIDNLAPAVTRDEGSGRARAILVARRRVALHHTAPRGGERRRLAGLDGVPDRAGSARAAYSDAAGPRWPSKHAASTYVVGGASGVAPHPRSPAATPRTSSAPACPLASRASPVRSPPRHRAPQARRGEEAPRTRAGVGVGAAAAALRGPPSSSVPLTSHASALQLRSRPRATAATRPRIANAKSS